MSAEPQRDTQPQSGAQLQRTAGEELARSRSLGEVLAAAERADGSSPISDQALIAARRGERTPYAVVVPVGSAEDHATVGGGDADANKTVGLGILGEGELDLVIHPRERGRGAGGAALDAMIAEHDSGEATGRELRAWAHGENPAARALLTRAGFAPIRSLYRLALDPSALPRAIADSRAMPEGFHLAAFDPGDAAQAAEWVRVNAAAFASHPEQGSVGLEDFEALQRESWFDPEDLLLAFETAPDTAADGPPDGSRLAGYAWIKTVDAEPDAEPDVESSIETGVETELYVLGVDPAHAGRGLGAALLGATLRRMAEHSPGRITLYVDGDNENARALYDRAGFMTDQLSTQWLRGAAE